ncbi:zinc ribbon domain-containing protein [Azonexus hydrophilus]|uniref:zinc ribbon domain-containing protein n=1 Tax=Azonexus hydrophilus TaxID=418702 RepID=UPI0012F8F439
MAKRMYDYVCADCNATKEAYVASDDTSCLVCLECGGEMHRAISVPKVLMAGGTEGQALKAIHEIQRNDHSRPLYFNA